MVRKKRYDRGDIRRLNAANILRQLRDHPGSSRAQVAEALGLTRATVSSIVTDLMTSGMVRETDYLAVTTGRPGLSLELNPDSGCIVAVEIDLDHISIVLSNAGKEYLVQKEIALPLGNPPEDCLLHAEQLVKEALRVARQNKLKCFGICVAWAGLVNREAGELAFGPTSGWEHVPLKERWESRFKVTVFVENEAHAGAIGSHHSGEARGKRNFIYFSLGVGLAAGVIVDGVLLRGKRGFAGQVGHTHFRDNGIRCNCGKEGCWVTEIGAFAIRRKLEAEGVQFGNADKSDKEWIDQVSEWAENRDERVLKVLDEVGDEIGQGLARLVQTFNPSMIIIGGRLGKLMRFSSGSIQNGLDTFTLPYMAENLKVLVSHSEKDPLEGCLDTVLDAVHRNPPLGE